MATTTQRDRITYLEVASVVDKDYEAEKDYDPDEICTDVSQDASTNKPPNTVTITRATYVFAFCAALNSAIIGFDTGVSTDAARKVQITFDLTDVEREAFVGCLNFFASKLFLLNQAFFYTRALSHNFISS
jgi:hypothetical protein